MPSRMWSALNKASVKFMKLSREPSLNVKGTLNFENFPIDPFLRILVWMDSYVLSLECSLGSAAMNHPN